MGFIDSYKHLEKLCGEIFSDSKGVSAYIDEMVKTLDGSYYVKSWDDDLKALKHYKWVRNQISHDPDCNEENMCEPGDKIWIDNFYSRIMNQEDPLSAYRKACSAARKSHSQTPPCPDSEQTKTNNLHESKNAINFAAILFAAIVLIIILIISVNK